MDNLRKGLGGQPPRNAELPELGLSLHELGELIRRAGRESGFIVESEYQVRIKGEQKVKQIDWVWLSPVSLSPIVAIEIEGQGAATGSLAKDILKFKACGALLNVIALFQVHHNRTIMKPPSYKRKPKDWVLENVDTFPVDIVLDEELMKNGGIEEFQQKAIHLLNNG